MATQSFIDRFRKAAYDLRAANGANVAVIFALAAVPMVGVVGAAVDYSRANSVKAAMQAAADATALMLSKTASTLSTADLQSQANSYFTALLNRPEATGLTVNATYSTTGGSQIVVAATADVKADFMGLIGVSSMKVGADSEVKWGNTRLRVALVLDNTGSMADDNKMTALKSATNSLLDQLKSSATNDGDVYVSIIPFSKDVNVGSSNYKQNWIDWTDWEANNGSCSSSKYDNQDDCKSHNKTWTADSHKNWNGCVTDRGNSSGPANGNYDTNVSAPSTTVTASLFPAEQYGSCTQAILPLSYNWTSMKTLVSGMQSNGNTNQGIGLAHGWMSLVGGGPYPAPPAMDSNYKYTQAIILLTDGLNTQNRWYTSQSSIDNRQAITCANAKAAGIVLYTVQVNTGGDPTSSLLQKCATDATKFFLLTSSTQIVSTFTSIGTALSNLRIAQ